MSRIVLHGETAKHLHISNYATRKSRTHRHSDVSDDWKHSCEVVNRAGNMTHLSCDPRWPIVCDQWPVTYTVIHIIYVHGQIHIYYEMTTLNELFLLYFNWTCAVSVKMLFSVFCGDVTSIESTQSVFSRTKPNDRSSQNTTFSETVMGHGSTTRDPYRLWPVWPVIPRPTDPLPALVVSTCMYHHSTTKCSAVGAVLSRMPDNWLRGEESGGKGRGWGGLCSLAALITALPCLTSCP